MLTGEDIREIAKVCHYYLDPFSPLLLAMVEAEGGRVAFIRAIKCSMPEVDTFDAALARACKTVRRLADKYQKNGGLLLAAPSNGDDPWTGEKGPKALIVSEDFIDFLAQVWAPVGVANDPTNLNTNWPKNVKAFYRKYALGERM